VAAWAALTLVVLLATATWLVRTDWGRAKLTAVIESQAARYIDGELSIGRLDGSLFGGADLHDVAIRRDGEVVFSVAQISGTYRLRDLFAPAIVLDHIVLTDPVFTVTETPDAWRVEGIRIPPSDPADPPSDTSILIRSLTLVNGHVVVRPIDREYELVDVGAQARVAIASDIVVDVRRLEGRETNGGLHIASFTTVVTLTDDATTLTPLDLRTPDSRVQGALTWHAGSTMEATLRSERLQLTEWQPYVDALDGIALSPAIDLRLRGPLDALRVTGPVQDPVAGDLVLDVVVNLTGVFAVRGAATVTNLDIAPWAVRPDLPTRLTGDVRFDLRDDAEARGLTGPFSATLANSRYQEHVIERVQTEGTLTYADVTATFNAGVYGASSTGSMTYDFASETTTVTGRIRNGNAARLPAFMALPPLEGDVNGTYTVVMTPTTFQIESVLDGSTLEGAAIGAGTIANITITNDTDVRYTLNGRIDGLDPKRIAPKLLDPEDPPIEWPFETATVSGQIAIEGAGAIEAPLLDHRATFSGTLDGDVDEARLRTVVLSGAVAARRLTATATGTAAGTWDRLAQWEGGGLEPDGTFAFTVDVPDLGAEFGPTFADGSVDLTLGRSRFHGIEVVSARVAATAAGGLITISDGQASGPVGRLEVTGTMALGDAGVSDLTYLVNISDLARLPESLAIEATGQVQTEGQLTGPFADPVMRGTFAASTLAMADISVLNATGTYDVHLPEFQTERLTGTAVTDATFIEAGGQSWPRATVTATFDQAGTEVVSTLEHERAVIDLTAGIASDADGTLEVRARAVTLRLPDEAWSMREGTTALIRSSETRLSIDRLELAKGDERLVFEGALPWTSDGQGSKSTERMRVEAAGVSVAPFVTTLMGAPRVSGLLDGTVIVTGAIDDPHVDAKFVLAGGEADGVPFRSIDGTVDLSGAIATVAVSLDAGERGSASVAGRVPVDPEAGGLDLTVLAKLTDVGVVAPAVPYVANASGSAHVDLRITGSQATPQIDGSATMVDVQFDVPETGVSYRRLNAGVRVVDSALVVERFTVEDPGGRVLQVTGRLDVLNRDRGGDVDLRIVARDFRLLGNRFGDLHVNLDLTAAGTVTAPQVIGSVGIERGRFEVDELLQQFTPSTAYVGVVTPSKGAAGADAHPAPAPPSIFSGAALSIDVILPENVVVRGRGLQTDDGPIGLGDINLTLGGTLQVAKAQGGEAGLVGEVSVVRGTYVFQGRRFAIERGSLLRFRGDDYANPTLDIRATREVSGVNVRVRIQGTAAAPSLTLSSEPSLDEGDILSLVVFNRPINQLGQGEKISLASRAGSLAAGAVVGPIADSVARALDLDVFEIQTAEAGAVGATVMVGRHLGDRLFVGFRHEFGGEGVNRLTFEYRLTEYLRIMTSVAPGGQPANRSARTETAGIDLIFVIRR
jgi:autotransporter translocation and assembly factor TamB